MNHEFENDMNQEENIRSRARSRRMAGPGGTEASNQSRMAGNGAGEAGMSRPVSRRAPGTGEAGNTAGARGTIRQPGVSRSVEGASRAGSVRPVGVSRSGEGTGQTGSVRPAGVSRSGENAGQAGSVRPVGVSRSGESAGQAESVRQSAVSRSGDSAAHSGSVRPAAASRGSESVRPASVRTQAARLSAASAEAGVGMGSSMENGGQASAPRSRRQNSQSAPSGEASASARPRRVFTPAYSQEADSLSDQETSRRDSGRKKRGTDKSGKKGGLRGLIISLALVQILIILGIFGIRYVKAKQSLFAPSEVNMEKMTNPNIDHSIVEKMEGYWTVALFGVDSRDDRLGKGNNADVIIICNINRGTGEIKLVSVFRDTYLSIDDNGSYNKINQAYARGGPEQAIKALNKNLDIQIDDYATFNWKAVADAINILGGVDVELSKAEFYYINAYITETVEATNVASKQAGMNHLDGVQAVAYARLRKMDTDFARTERQRLIIQLCFDKLKQSNFSVINNIMEVVFPQVMTSVRFDDLIPLAKNITTYSIGETMGFPQARTDVVMGKKGDCVIPATLESNVIALHQFLFDETDYQPSDQVKKISNKIASDSGAYKEAQAVESVGTDGGYIPKPTEPKQTETEEAAKDSTAESDESESSTGETDESIIDGEYDWGLELETDENGNYIDPPEDYGPGATKPSSGLKPEESSSSYPGATSPSESQSRPGETAPSASYPGGTTPGTTSPGTTTPGGNNSSTILPPNGTVTSTEGNTGPGGNGNSQNNGTANGTLAPYPGAVTDDDSSNGPGSVIIGPGGNS